MGRVAERLARPERTGSARGAPGLSGQITRVTLYDGGQIIADLDSAGYRQSEYVYDEGTDRPYAVMTGPTAVTLVRYFAQDDFGNVQGLFADSSHATQEVSYGDWGLPTVTGDTMSRLTWKGLSYDPDVDLIYMRARWYDPDIARFVSEDPAGLQGGINPYVFANNDPINGSDPSGADPYGDCIEHAREMFTTLSEISSFDYDYHDEYEGAVLVCMQHAPHSLPASFGELGDTPNPLFPPGLYSTPDPAGTAAGSNEGGTGTSGSGPKWKSATCAMSLLQGALATGETIGFIVTVGPEVLAADGLLSAAGILAGGLAEHLMDPTSVYYSGRYRSVLNTNMTVARTMLNQMGHTAEDAFVANAKHEALTVGKYLGGLTPGYNMYLARNSINADCRG